MENAVLVDSLKDIYGKKIISVVIYGENQNIMVVFNEFEASDLAKAIPVIKKWRKTGKPLPIVMSKDEWLSSADVYPIEYTEIKNNYKVLFGEDVVSLVEIPKHNLRIQSEYEIKNLLVRLRQLYLGNSDKPQFMVKTLEDISASLIRILKSVITLFDFEAPEDYSDVIQKITGLRKFDGEIFVEILSASENKRKVAPQKVEALVQRAINSMDLLYSFINDLENIF